MRFALKARPARPSPENAAATAKIAEMLPVWGALLAVALLDETFHAYHGIALALILAGIALAEYGGRRTAAR